MTEIPAPPPGYEVLEVEGDPDEMNLDDLRFRAPDGTIVTAAEVYGDESESEDDDSDA